MPPVIPDPQKILSFADHDAFYNWLAAHHASWDELWLQIHKKGSGLPTVSYQEAVCAALCWGWIDGIKKSLDERSFLQRFSPRRPKSIWSQVNTKHVARLIEAGLMQPQGLAHVEAAKADGRWDAAYASSRSMEMPEDFLLALGRDTAAAEFFATLNAANRYAILFRISGAKKPETRMRNIEKFVAMLGRGETLYPNGKTPK